MSTQTKIKIDEWKSFEGKNEWKDWKNERKHMKNTRETTDLIETKVHKSN